MRRLAVSNLSWDPSADARILPLLRSYGVTGVEIAPTKVWPQWQGATAQNAERYRRTLTDAGFSVPALQAVLFGRPELSLFDPACRRAYVEHFRLVADLAAALGAHAIVLGAPKNRDRGGLSWEEALARAAEVFVEVGAECAARGTCLCIEPNPPVYGCNFVVNALEGVMLVERVASPGFALHLDAAGMYLAGDQPEEVLPRALSHLRHFHLSEPDLAGFETPRVDHRRNIALLNDLGYQGWLSVEMKAELSEFQLQRIMDAIG